MPRVNDMKNEMIINQTTSTFATSGVDGMVRGNSYKNSEENQFVSLVQYFLNFENVKTYCRQRLEEVREINKKSPTPSAFGCIMSLIGFLSLLRYNGKKDDTHEYSGFCNSYLKRLKCKRDVVKAVANTSFQQRKGQCKDIANTWGEVIYSMIRCGLLHRMSVEDRNAVQNQVRIRLTHGHVDAAQYHEFLDSSGVPVKVANACERVVITISAHDLLDVVGSALDELFLDKDFEINAIAYLKDHPAIVALGKNAANEVRDLSVIYEEEES